MNLIEHLVSPGTTVVDVGANIGWFTINVSKFLGKGGCVVAVEPDEVNSRRFLKALEMFPAKSKVRFEPCALSNKSGFGILDLDPANPANHKITNMLLEGRLIKLKTLDELVESEKNISFVKIDVQGHELNVLEGGKHTLTKCKPAVVIEIDNTTNFLNPELIWDFMKSIGYRVYFIENQQLEVTKEMLLARKGYFDCICLPD